MVSEQALTEPQTRPHIFKTLVKSLRMSGLVVGGVDIADIVPILTLPDGQKIPLMSDEYHPHHVSNWPPALESAEENRQNARGAITTRTCGKWFLLLLLFP